MTKDENRSKKNRRSRKFLTIALLGGTVIVWILIAIGKYFWLQTFNWKDVVESIMDNLLGVLPPIIIFNFLYEYLSQDYTNDEMSEKITESLMTSPESLENFDTDAKKRFIQSSMNSLVGIEKGNMLYEHMDRYLEQTFDIRSYFNYEVDLQEKPFVIDEQSQTEYYTLGERITYIKKYQDGLPKRFALEFCMQENDLDERVKKDTDKTREKLYNIFAEDLNIEERDLQVLQDMSEHELQEFVLNRMGVKIYINDEVVEQIQTHATAAGITVDCEIREPINEEVKVDIGFQMPFPTDNSKVLMLIREPTYSPQMRFSYPQDKLNITTIAFFDNEIKVNDASRFVNKKEFVFNKQWIMPLSGVIYLVEKKL